MKGASLSQPCTDSSSLTFFLIYLIGLYILFLFFLGMLFYVPQPPPPPPPSKKKKDHMLAFSVRKSMINWFVREIQEFALARQYLLVSYSLL
ncbi:hypothetical protein WN944_027630 [Citrus x changshan-huyou]|uniref:Uncharacterized protein n=1 Tax=Citrus x changshan-huyou TaxID=2935761 RepID=A0AAP0Q9C8_9ROSI